MAPKKKAGRRSKAAKHSKRTGNRKTGKAATRKSATRKSATRKSAARKSAARKSAAGKSAARSSNASKSTTRKSISRKAARGMSTLRQSVVRSLPAEGVGTAVMEKARHGFELAREGLERLKDTTVDATTNVIESVRERIARDDRLPESERAAPSEPGPTH